MKNQGRHKHTIWIYDDLWERITARYPVDGTKRPPHGAINMLLATGLSVMMGLTCAVNEETCEYHAHEGGAEVPPDEDRGAEDHDDTGETPKR